MKGILEKAAKVDLAQMLAQSFGDHRLERHPWKDRPWEWASLRFEDGDFNTATHLDATACEKWFYQAADASPAMFRRTCPPRREGRGVPRAASCTSPA